MNAVFLTGFMGSGKTTIGRVLAQRTGEVFVDLDDEIVRRIGMSIVQIFARHGENHFRRIESALLRELASGDGILALGGGAVLDPDSRMLIKESGTVIYLRASAATLIERLGDESALRPLLEGVALEDFIPAMLRERSAIYEEAHLIIDTDALTPPQVTDEIVEKIGEIFCEVGKR